MLGLVAIPMFALIAVLAYDTYRQYTSDVAKAYQTARTIRSLSGAKTEQFLANAEVLLSKLAQRPRIRGLDATRCDPLLAELRELQTAYANILTLDAKGSLVCSAVGRMPGPGAGPDPKYYFSEVMRTGKFTIGKPARGFITDRWVVTLAYPIRDDAGKLNGAVAISIDLTSYQLVFSSKDMPPRTVIGILNSDGTIIARSEHADQRVGKQAANPETTKSVLRLREGDLRVRDFQGVERFYSFAPIANSDWFIYVGLDEAAAIAPVMQLALEHIALVISLLLALTAITAMVARRLARPVEEISKTMENVGAGAIHERAALAGPAELRQIAARLNAMLDARAQAEATLRQSEERFRTAFRTSPDSLVITTTHDGRYLEVNDGQTLMVGWSREELIGKTERDIKVWRHAEDRQKLVEAMKRDGSCTNLEAEFVRKDGSMFTGLVSSHAITLDGLPCILSITRDISVRKAAEEQIHNLSFFDPLTMLPNRRLFMDRLEQARISRLRHRREGALLFVDLDDFRMTNETLGHEQGDIFLQEVSRRLKNCVRLGNTVGRLGGDDFVILLEDLGATPQEAASQAEAMSEKILFALAQPYLFANVAHHRTASIGIALFGNQVEGSDEPLKRAELAMYQAKAAGRNTLRFFDPEMQAAVSTRVAMEDGLHEAIENNQLVLHYQVQVTDPGQVTGVEALVRWRDPVRGMIFPADFIPLAEKSGLILPLGRWVLEAACAQLALWAGRPGLAHLCVAVNVSARQFHQDDFVDQVLSVLKRSGADPHRLKLEMTESTLIDSVEKVIAKMSVLKEIGVGFSLDDFGTGYSSLSYLKRLPLDQLKIDQGFVRDILIDPNDAAIARMIIALAASMGLTVIAEGVETAAQRDVLADLGCSTYQGFFFGRPMPAQDFEAFMQGSGSRS
ncbi:EAL domain-containing protein [Lacisediminimonas sp.]|uniref:bifunctional diguanylate cyclase/phosphodiesterase n=1 Tax=Lacisediminimonas sp. TaxID=3060582 RepID=UPI002718AC10|nr:EAL domain-containing protein [Lacisediminimonas sp.]MDO8298787.1 EAL domain-containing protein [Lacisediminimonas sp.]